MTKTVWFTAKIVSTLQVDSFHTGLRPYMSEYVELTFRGVERFSSGCRTKIFTTLGGKTYFQRATEYITWLWTHGYINGITRADCLVTLSELRHRLDQLTSDGEMTVPAALSN